MYFNYNDCMAPCCCAPPQLNSVNPLGQRAIKILGLIDARAQEWVVGS